MQYGLIGKNIEYSFSKMIHEALGYYSYDLMSLDTTSFHSFMQQKNFTGINVTIPYKKDVIPYLDALDTIAQQVQAVNTIVKKNNQYIGYNTDVAGFQYLLDFHQIQLQNKKVVLLGNGGASQSIQYVLSQRQIASLIIVDTNGTKGITYEECYQKHTDAHIIINATPVGTSPNLDDSPIQLDNFTACETVIDIIYNPMLTQFTYQAKKRGIKHVNGLEMLVAQAVYAAQLFLDKQLSANIIHELYQKLHTYMCNIVLIGMPGAGKTTIGNMLAKHLNRQCIDIDEKIEEKTSMSIPTIFHTKGEATFRDIETQVIQEVSTYHHTIIATGGGSVLREINMDRLQLNGCIIFIDRPIDQLHTIDPNRPLLNHTNAIQDLYEKRYPLYKKYAHITISNDQTLENTLQQILNAITIFDKHNDSM